MKIPEKLEAFDAAILSGCTRLSRHLQKTIGLTNFLVAKIALFVAVVSVLVEIINHFNQFLPSNTSIVEVAFGGLVLGFLFFSIALQQTEDASWSDVKPGLSRFLVETPASRLVWVALSMHSCFFLFSLKPGRFLLLEMLSKHGFNLSMVVFSYFISIIPLPPGTSKVGEWLGRFAPTPALARQEN